MSFKEFYFLSENLPFTVSITMVTILSLLEGVAFVLGFGVISFLDSLLPDFDFELDGPTLEDAGFVSKTLSFLRVENVPVIILFVCFLMSFGVSGLLIQGFWMTIMGFSLNPLFIAPFAFAIGVVLMKGFGTVIARVIPDDETDARTLENFVGKVGVITLGVSKDNQPAQCKVKDHVGSKHYFMVLPDVSGEELSQGTRVLFVRYNEPYFYVIKPNNENL